MRSFDLLAALWMWPVQMMQANIALAETAAGIPTILGARLPMIGSAMLNPWTANHRELALMVSEKTKAFGLSQKHIQRSAQLVRSATEANARALGTFSMARMGAAEMFDLAEKNLAAAASLVNLPSSSIAPIHKQVSGNAKRLAKPATRRS
ncbi:hypothetical protein [Sphingobium yanoikuyae]|uniref:Phasin domain-containing protein n=1 Tax=Sphingobium yanoikuyae TaxID=13690 RepID=A0A430BQL9_SPHYA|nr:hypothetical protein [Sphingobium yanoikuyae]KAK0346973.1 hypothetical protein LTR94_004363 [Friedmanniomyces endolithicus]RSU55034.1 hypothetical protein DAH51_18340 [Sphingobium yanoikuyae]